MRPERLLPILVLVVGAAAFLMIYQKKTQPVPVPLEVADQPGPRLFFEHDCVTCHSVSRLPGARGTLGPGLDEVGRRAAERDPDSGGRDYLRQSLVEPGAVVRDGFVNAMPSYAGRMSPEEITTMVEWLTSLRGDPDA